MASRPAEVRCSFVLAAIGAWTVVVPYLGRAVGLGVNVPARVEFVDHVVPGGLVALAGLYLAGLARRRALAGTGSALLASGVCFLAGVWVLATHVPLVGDAANATQPWGAAIWHSTAALPIVGLSVWCVLRCTAARA